MFHIALSRFSLKQSYDALAITKLLARGDLNLEQKTDCVKFYFTAYGINRLYATLPRSGFHYLTLVMEIVLDLANGGDGNYSFAQNFWWPKSGVRYEKLDWRATKSTPETTGLEPTELLFYHTHLPFYRVRSAMIWKMRCVVQVRNIIDVLESFIYRWTGDGTNPEAFPWKQHCLSGYHPHPLYVVCLLGLQARAGAGALRRRSG